MNSLVRKVISMLVAVAVLFPSALLAKPVYFYFQVNVDPPGPGAAQYADGAKVIIMDSNGDVLNSGSVESGVASLDADIIPGDPYTFVVEFATDNATYPLPGIYLPLRKTLVLQPGIVDPAGISCDNNLDSCDFIKTVQPANYEVRVVVEDADKNAISNVDVTLTGECGNPAKRNVSLNTGNNNTVRIGVVDNDQCVYNAFLSKPGYIDHSFPIYPNYNQNKVNRITAILEQPDPNVPKITINFNDLTNSAFPLGSEESISASCFEVGVSDGKKYFGWLFPNSGQQIVVPVSNGTYDCDVNFFTDGLYNIELLGEEVVVENGNSPDPLTAVIKNFTEKLEVTIFDGNGVHEFTEESEEYGEVSCSSVSGAVNRHYFSIIEPGGDNPFLMGITPGKWHCNAGIEGYTSSEAYLKVKPNETVPLNLTLQKLDAVINVVLEDTSGQPFTEHTEKADVYCHDPESELGSQFHGEGNPGESSFSIPALNGEYECYLHVDGYAGATADVTVVAGSGDLVFRLDQPLDGTLNVSVIDATTKQQISGLPLNYFVHPRHEFDETSDDDVVFHDGQTNEDGFASFQVPTGVNLEVGISEPFKSFGEPQGTGPLTASNEIQSSLTVQADDGNIYFIPYQPKSFNVDPNTGTADIVFELVKPTTYVEVTLTNPTTGQPVTQGFVDAVSFDFDEDDEPIDNAPPSSEFDDKDHFVGAPIRNGSAIFPLIADREYEIIAMPRFSQGSRLIPPPVQRVTLTEGEHPYSNPFKIDLELQVADHDLTIDIQTATSSASIFVDTEVETNCFAFREGVPVFIPEVEGNSTTIPLVVGEDLNSWEVGCHRIAGNEETEQYKSFVGHTYYTPQKGASTGTVTVVLEEDNDYFPPKELEFDVSQDATLRFHNLRISVPATAFGSSGTGTLKIGSSSSVLYSDSDRPLDSYDFLWTVAGQTITTPSLPVTVRFPVDLDKLAALGVSIDSLYAGHFNSDTNKWIKDGSVSITTVTDPITGEQKSYATVTMSSFSSWGTIVNKGKELKASLSTDLKARKRVKKVKGPNIPNKVKYTLQWKGPSNAVKGVTEYDVDVQLTKVKRKKKKRKKKKNKIAGDWSKVKTYSTTDTSITKKFKVGNKYEFRVRVKGGTNSFSKKFRVKAPRIRNK